VSRKVTLFINSYVHVFVRFFSRIYCHDQQQSAKIQHIFIQDKKGLNSR